MVKEYTTLSPKEMNPFLFEGHLKENLPYFSGHYPGSPILPAVVYVEISLDLMREYCEVRDPHLKSIDRGKFHEPVSPNQPLEIEVRLGEGSSHRVLWSSQGKVLCDLKLSLV